MIRPLSYLLAIFAMLASTAAHAVTLGQCTRTTHISHGGQADHRDLGEGRVMWRDWWSQEGTSTSFTIVDCASGRALAFLTAEENMNARLPFDRTDKALAVVERHEKGSRLFATFERIADDLMSLARDVSITDLPQETCACAALYPELRGPKTAFVLDQGAIQ